MIQNAYIAVFFVQMTEPEPLFVQFLDVPTGCKDIADLIEQKD
jgi:hypothetical protein